MSKLFAVFLGGRAKGCNIETHDAVFVVSDKIENAYPQLKAKWFGLQKGLHIDAYIELTHAEGFDISLTQHKTPSDHKLFFVNFGGNKANYFGEVHESGFFVGTTQAEVKARAKSVLCADAFGKHCDDNLVVEDLIAIDEVDGYYLQFTEAEHKEIKVHTKYLLI